MRVLAVTPILVTPEELTRRQERYRRLSPPGVEVNLRNLPERTDVPRRLETAEDIAASEALVLEVARHARPGEADLVLPDCVLDPGVDAGVETPLPVVGILKLAVGLLRTLGLRFSAVTRNRPIGDELVSRIQRYGYDDTFAGLDVLDLDFDAISDETRWHTSLRPAVERARGEQARAVVNGCSAVELPAERNAGVALVDPTRLALELLGVAARTGASPAANRVALA